jgi:HlyD family secretion protein
MISPKQTALAALERADSIRWERWVGYTVLAAFVAVAGTWAAYARLDAAAYAQGFVVVSGSRKSIQHQEGGIVSRLLVKEGQSVKRGDVLVEFEGGNREAESRALIAEAIALETNRARLLAVRDNLPVLQPPAWLETLDPSCRDEAELTLEGAQRALDAQRQSLAAQKSVLVQRAEQLRAQIHGTEIQAAAVARQIALIVDELKGTRQLAAKGLTPLTRVRALQRAMADLEGQHGVLLATAARGREAIGETELQALSLDAAESAKAIDELKGVVDKLNALTPRRIAALDRLSRTRVRAPATGTIVGLTIHTEQGVAAPGQVLMEIVPSEEALVIEAMLSPDSADDVVAGMQTEVRFSAFHRRDIPVLNGVVLDVSPDRFVDERTGASFFKLRVEVSPQALAALRDSFETLTILKPGLPCEVIVPLRARTALAYLLEPLDHAVWRSMREQ